MLCDTTVRATRHMVELPRTQRGRCGRPRTWGYGYPELAALLGMTEVAVRQAVARRAFMPGDLASVVVFARRRGRLP